MNKIEAVEIMKRLKAIYGYVYKDYTHEMLNEVAKAWSELLQPYTLNQVMEALNKFVMSDKKGYPPTPGIISGLIATPERTMTALEAWQKVMKAAKHTSGIEGDIKAGVNERAFNELPEICKKIIGSPNQLRRIAMTDQIYQLPTIKKDFMETFKYFVEDSKTFTGFSEVAESLKIKDNNDLLFLEG